MICVWNVDKFFWSKPKYESTHKKHLQVVALDCLEQVGHSTFQSTMDEDAIAEMVQQDCPQNLQVT